jgi:NAD(P)H-dependent flavin oxidoreductase YrpB (nitropropane dioxygenase family)
MGADGVQMGTRFAASVESAASDEFKQLYVRSTPQDVVLIESPVGLPGRALKNQFWRKLTTGQDLTPANCDGCLKRCGRSFCILHALEAAQQGDMENGLVFSGASVPRVKDILPVKAIFQRLLEQVRLASES